MLGAEAKSEACSVSVAQMRDRVRASALALRRLVGVEEGAGIVEAGMDRVVAHGARCCCSGEAAVGGVHERPRVAVEPMFPDRRVQRAGVIGNVANLGGGRW